MTLNWKIVGLKASIMFKVYSHNNENKIKKKKNWNQQTIDRDREMHKFSF